jgi:hypothetical protein
MSDNTDFEIIKNNIENTYNIIEFNEGHFKTLGVTANCYKNPFWKIKENDTEIILMYCEKKTICKLCPISYQNILDYEKTNAIKITWFTSTNGYITGNNNLTMHQIIMNCYGNGKGTKNISVDHIDRNKLNNCYNNLRIATFEEQHSNCKGILPDTKRERKYNARPLPEGITQNMMKKYVVFYEDYADKEKKRLRQYFKIEKHPKLQKIWIGCKSNNVSILEKLNQANKVIDDLENNTYSENNNKQILTNNDKNIIVEPIIKIDNCNTSINNKINKHNLKIIEDTLQTNNIKEQIYKEKSEKMKGEGNHNYGKTFSEETKNKMSLSIRNAKDCVSDDIIINVRKLLQEGYKNIDIQNLLNLPRHTVTRIKNGDIVCRNEEKQLKIPLKQEDMNISKRKINVDDIIIILEKYSDKWKPTQILNYFKEQQKDNITIDIIKNIKRNLQNNKPIIYEKELTKEKYDYYLYLINKCIEK